jgi:hypothetical protein
MFASNDHGNAKLFLLCINYSGIDEFHGLGQLTPAQMATLQGREEQVTDAQLALGQTGYEAFGAEDPLALNAFLERDLSELPYLRSSLERLQQEYPWRGNGLARSQRQLLGAVMPCGGNLTSMFLACAEQEEARYLGDMVFLDYALKLTLPPEPALRFVDGSPSPSKPSRAYGRPLALTPFGRRLLTGNGDLIRAVGINRWIGGVHLMGDRWRYDPETARVYDARGG